MSKHRINIPRVCVYCGERFISHGSIRNWCYKKQCDLKRRREYDVKYRKRKQTNKTANIIPERQWRRCLRCDRLFLSEGIENRICNSCKNINRGFVSEDCYGGIII